MWKIQLTSSSFHNTGLCGWTKIICLEAIKLGKKIQGTLHTIVKAVAT